MKCPIAASLDLQCVPMTCMTSPMSLLGDSKNRSLQIPHGHQFLMNACLSPGMCPCLSGSFKFPEVVQLAPMMSILGFPGGTSGKELSCQCRRHKRYEFDPWFRQIPWRRSWPHTIVFSPRESHEQRSLVGYSPRGHCSHAWLFVKQWTVVSKYLLLFSHA